MTFYMMLTEAPVMTPYMMLAQAVVVTPDFTAQTEVPLFRHRFTIKGHVCFRAAVLPWTHFLSWLR
jgi:hypothetical protein